MPSSNYVSIQPILEIATQLQPKSVLDIGAGYGKYGALLREYLDGWNVSTGVTERNVLINGIEIFPGYKNPVWGAYDTVVIGDALTDIEVIQRHYDLVIMVDIIEHLSKEQGQALINRLDCDTLIIVTPENPSNQGVVYGNEHERHVSRWEPKDLPEFKCMRVATQLLYIKSTKVKIVENQ